MTSDKQIITISWKANKLTFVLILVSILFCAYGTKQFDESYITPIYVYGFIQTLSALLAVLFFYSGVSRTDKFKLLMALLSLIFTYSLIANVTSQSFIIVNFSSSSILLNLSTAVCANILAIMTTLTFARLKRVSVERDPEKKPRELTKLETTALATNPLVLATIILAVAIILGLYPPPILEDKSFCITMAFFFWVQLGTTWILTKLFFPDYQGNKRWRAFFSILALALLIGAVSNHAHEQFTTRVGNRVDINTVAFVIMNSGALFTTLAFHMWKDYLGSIKSKLESIKGE